MRINYAFILRITLLAFFGLFLILAETSVMTGLRVYGVSPVLTMSGAICVAVCFGEREGAVFGLSAGFVSDVLGSSPFLFSTLFYMFAAYFVGVFVKLYVSTGFVTALLSCAAALLARQLFSAFYMLGTWGHLPLSTAFLHRLLPELIYSAVLSAAIYPLTRLMFNLSKR
ncbi:MAG: hypothetical protein AB9835_13570 [Eubacteriales bacterium]